MAVGRAALVIATGAGVVIAADVFAVAGAIPAKSTSAARRVPVPARSSPAGSVPGSSVAGSSVPGSSVAGSSVPGSSVAGSSVPGSSVPGTSLNGAAPAGPAPGPWKLSFDDEFAGGAIDASKWSTNWLGPPGAVTPPVNSYEMANYAPGQVSVAGGYLRLHADGRPSTAYNGESRPYTSGLVNTDGKAQFTYGFFQARVFLPNLGGSLSNWPAFWTDGQHWPADGEMDVMEGLEGRACWHFHSPAGAPGGCASGHFGGWHTYGADWEPGSVTYYYDGRRVGGTHHGVTSAPMYLILNLAVGGDQSGPVSLPATMLVDYVKVWQH